MALSVEEKTILAVGCITGGFLLIFLIYSYIVYKLGWRSIQEYGGGLQMKDLLKKDKNQGAHLNEIPSEKIKFVEYGGKGHFVASLVLSLLVFVFFELLILTLVMFDHIHVAGGIIIMLIVSFVYWGTFIVQPSKSLIQETILERPLSKWSIRFGKKINNIKHTYGYWIGYAILVLAIVAANILLEGTCENNLEIVSTRIFRKYQSPSCPEGVPCLVYLTLTETPHQSIYVNYHSSNPSEVGTFCIHSTFPGIPDNFSRVDDSLTKMTIGSSFKMDIEVRRNVHYVLLENLDPSTVYYFRCGTVTYGFSSERKFQTLSVNSTSGYSFVVGGDMDSTETSMVISEIAARQEPQFALLGGDLAYDRAQLTCYRLVDKWLDMYQTKMITPQGFTIPMVATIGNHEVIGDFDATPQRIPFFTKYFAQSNYIKQTNQLSQIEDRLTYGYVNIGGPNGTVIFNLDSGHSASMTTQKEWMQDVLESNVTSPQFKFAIYHVPMYPTIRTYENTHSTAVRSNWLSYFDEISMTVGFENHDHAYKRTYPMINGVQNPNGTVYIGDGAWGVTARPAPDQRFYQVLTKSLNYVTYVKVSPTNKTVTFQSFSKDGNIFDEGVMEYK
ncbi:hypothetical protein DLAC_08896 [Tieghemostelium lacteum]|uniref:Purple acid phosphatase n=1 Tax=Tieghemostelium lacteum TaxID=361077 RepID=A0A151Z8J6_TIELA|nr:hypothetical protein DLAC_08896 [Tieghemostelium lacteum]|eukprot:KYQ90293.1 hypothetical protein DLAC_08896 [Tieghemostelium lacteum]